MVGLAFLKSIYQKHMCNDFFGCRFICAMLYTKRSRIEGNMMTTSPEKSGHTMLQYQLNLDKFYTQIIMCVHLYIYICTCGFLFPKTYFFDMDIQQTCHLFLTSLWQSLHFAEILEWSPDGQSIAALSPRELVAVEDGRVRAVQTTGELIH